MPAPPTVYPNGAEQSAPFAQRHSERRADTETIDVLPKRRVITISLILAGVDTAKGASALH